VTVLDAAIVGADVAGEATAYDTNPQTVHGALETLQWIYYLR
jgi:hypothetical protein